MGWITRCFLSAFHNLLSLLLPPCQLFRNMPLASNLKWTNHYEKDLWVLFFDMLSWCCFQLIAWFHVLEISHFVFVHILFIHIFIHIWGKKTERKDHTRGLHCILWVALSACKREICSKNIFFSWQMCNMAFEKLWIFKKCVRLYLHKRHGWSLCKFFSMTFF